MTSYRRSSAEQGSAETYPIIEECTKDQGVVRRYTKGRFLGKGGFAKCYEFTNLESKKVGAAKVIPKISLTKSRAKQKLMSEIKIHRSLRHQNVVGFEHFFEDHENVYILLEMCTNQTMNELIKRRKRLTELEVQCYLMQILNAVKYLHDHRVIHRDLKLGNLFLSDKMEIKLGDFGLATKLEFDGERKRTICGTPNYIAPEILEGKDSGHSYEVDVWSLGVIAYTLLIGKPPFETNDVKTTYRRIKMNEYSFPDGVQISSAARSMIKNILVTDPAKRLTINEMFNHEFFKSSGSIPKLLPVSTLACPPSSQYIRQFQIPPSSSSSTTGGSRQSDNLVGRSQSPKRFESTAPFPNSTGLGSQASSTAYNPTNLKSSQQIGLKERKDFVNTYRSGSGGVSTNGLTGSTELGYQKNIQASSSAASSGYGIKSEDQAANTQGFNTNQASSSATGNMSSQQKNIKSTATIQSATSVGFSSNTNNQAEVNSSGGNGIYQSYSSKQPSQNQPTRNPIEKYSSSNNLNQINSSQGSAITRARSEKMNTQPTSSLLQSYGIPQQLAGSGSLFAAQSTLPASDPTLQAPDIWVKKWVDYSAKYGLGYLLNNGEAGIFFNDSTKIILDPETKIFEYYERRPEKTGQGVQHTLSTYPPELQKKVTLLLHFQKYLEGDDKTETKKEGPISQKDSETNNNGKIYVKKWLRTKHAILFIFSNKVAQVIFQDSTEIVLSDELRVLTYVNKKHERLVYPLNSVTQQSTNNEMTKRLKYTKDLLAHIFNNNGNNNNNNQIPNTNNPLTQVSKNSSQQEPFAKVPYLDSNTNNTNSNYQSQTKPILQPRENLHFSKNQSSVPSTSSQTQFSQPHSYPISYNNFTQNENVNTLLSSKTGLLQTKTVTSGFGGSINSNVPKKEIPNMGSGNNSGMNGSSGAYNLLKSNSSFGRINSANQAQSSSLSNLNNNNNFSNYILSSRKTDF